jgi:Na+/H+ antiporter NhaC
MAIPWMLRRCCLLLVLGACFVAGSVQAQTYELRAPDVVLRGAPFDFDVSGADSPADSAALFEVRIGSGDPRALEEGPDGALVLTGATVESLGSVSIELLREGEMVAETGTSSIPGWTSILPPLLAIAFALAFKQVIPALFLGIWMGAWAALGFQPWGVWNGLLDTFQVFVLTALANPDHAAIILFSLMIGGMVGIISRNGGMQGVVEHIVRWARTPRDGQLATALLGLAIFFDDYANTLVVGNTMRPVTDRLQISREKLAYIVDSTAAPVACLALVSTWIGYEVGLIGTSVAGIDGFDESAYSIFLQSILYSFYPILALFFVFNVAASPKEFGPMLNAERRARRTGEVLSPGSKLDEAAASEAGDMAPKGDIAYRTVNAVLPVTVLVVSVLGGLYVTGEGENMRDVIGSADPYSSLMWGSLLGVVTAASLSLVQRLLSVDEIVSAWYAGVKSMLYAAIILVLAWALAEVTTVIHTADYLVSVLGETLPPGIVPTLVFIIAAATAFSTGTSWGTMGILMPLVIPLAWAILQLNGMADPAHYYVIYSSVSCVLAGAVWGDHCSPISDTTILSSMASGCDHIDHVRTQLPYALLVGAVGIGVGTLPTGFGFPWWLSMLLGAAVLFAGLRVFGQDVLDPEERRRHRQALAQRRTAGS